MGGVKVKPRPQRLLSTERALSTPCERSLSASFAHIHCITPNFHGVGVEHALWAELKLKPRPHDTLSIIKIRRLFFSPHANYHTKTIFPEKQWLSTQWTELEEQILPPIIIMMDDMNEERTILIMSEAEMKTKNKKILLV